MMTGLVFGNFRVTILNLFPQFSKWEVEDLQKVEAPTTSLVGYHSRRALLDQTMGPFTPASCISLVSLEAQRQDTHILLQVGFRDRLPLKPGSCIELS